MADIIDKLNDYLLDVENLSNEFLPLKDKLNPIKQDINNALEDLKEKSENSEDLADRVFYINRYTDLIKKVESIFDIRSRRLQQAIQTISKLPLLKGNNEKEQIQSEISDTDLTPEQCNEIFKILNQNKESE